MSEVEGGLTIPEEAREAARLAMNDGVWTSHHRERWGPQVDTILTAAAPLIVAAERERLRPELEFLSEHADDYNVPLALHAILAGTWDLTEAQEHVRRVAELRGGAS